MRIDVGLRLRGTVPSLVVLALTLFWQDLTWAALQAGKYTGKIQFPDAAADLAVAFVRDAERVQAEISVGAPVNLEGRASGDAVLCRMQGTTTQGEKLDLLGNCWGQQYNGTLTLIDANGRQRRGKYELQLQDHPVAASRPPETTRAARAASGAEAKSALASPPAAAATAAPLVHPNTKSSTGRTRARSAGEHHSRPKQKSVY